MLPIYFAPLQGYTEDVYRLLHHELFGHVEAYYTPFVRLENGSPRSKDLRDIKPENNVDLPLVVQIIASSAAEVETLLSVVTPLGYKRVDINMGCPFPLQTRHGRGAGLLPRPNVVNEICDIVRRRDDVTFSVKMRLGLTSADEWHEIVPILNDTPLANVVVHPRVASQQYKGTTDMEAFASFVDTCRHPVIYNGDVATPQQIHQLEATYPIAGVMIGRGLLARPSLAADYQTGVETSQETLISSLKTLHTRMLADYERIIPSDSQRLMKVRTMWDFMEETLGRKAWKKVMKAGNMKNYLAAIDQL